MASAARGRSLGRHQGGGPQCHGPGLRCPGEAAGEVSGLSGQRVHDRGLVKLGDMVTWGKYGKILNLNGKNPSILE